MGIRKRFDGALRSWSRLDLVDLAPRGFAVMNLRRLRELVKAGKDGALRPEEAKELFEALPDVLDIVENALTDPEAGRPSFALEPDEDIMAKLAYERNWGAFKPGDMK